MGEGRLAEAEQHFEDATRSDPKSTLAWNLLGHARYQAKRWQDALRAYRAALALSPALPQLYANAGVCEFELQQFDAAEASLRKAVSLDPAYALPHITLGRIATLREDPARAEAELRSAVRLGPKDATAHYFLGMLLFQAKRYPEARSELEMCLALNPDMPSAHLNLGLLLVRTGQTEEGQTHLSRFKTMTEVQLAGERLARDLSRRLMAARADLDAGRPEAALAAGLDARTLAPGEPAVHALLADIYGRMGKAEDAARERQEFERLTPAAMGR